MNFLSVPSLAALALLGSVNAAHSVMYQRFTCLVLTTTHDAVLPLGARVGFSRTGIVKDTNWPDTLVNETGYDLRLEGPLRANAVFDAAVSRTGPPDQIDVNAPANVTARFDTESNRIGEATLVCNDWTLY